MDKMGHYFVLSILLLVCQFSSAQEGRELEEEELRLAYPDSYSYPPQYQPPLYQPDSRRLPLVDEGRRIRLRNQQRIPDPSRDPRLYPLNYYTLDDGAVWPLNSHLTPPRRSRQWQSDYFPNRIYDYRYYDQTNYLYGKPNPLELAEQRERDYEHERPEYDLRDPRFPVQSHDLSVATKYQDHGSRKINKNRKNKVKSSKVEAVSMTIPEERFRKTRVDKPSQEVRREHEQNPEFVYTRPKSGAEAIYLTNEFKKSPELVSTQPRPLELDVVIPKGMTREDYNAFCFYTLYYFRNKDFGFFCGRTGEQTVTPLLLG